MPLKCGLDLKKPVYGFDSATADLCLSVYPCASLRSTKPAVKRHALLDVRGASHSFDRRCLDHARSARPVDRVNTPVMLDQTVTREAFYSRRGDPAALPRVAVKDHEGKRVVFLTNNTRLPPETVGESYRLRWQVDLRSTRCATAGR